MGGKENARGGGGHHFEILLFRSLALPLDFCFV